MFFNTASSDHVVIRMSSFVNQACSESCYILTVSDPILPFAGQLDYLLKAISTLPHDELVPVFMRFYLSDAANQTALLKERIGESCPVSIVGQAPLDGSKIAAWVWLRRGACVRRISACRHMVNWAGTDEYWFTGGLSGADGSFNQTVMIFDGLCGALEEQGMTLETDCVRTWLFVQNIDVNYKGVTDARNSVFDRHNLTPKTHFIASTGIEGRTELHRNLVMLDAVSVKGPGIAVSHLYGTSHLNRTSEYDVRFERGSVVGYGGFRHVFISGTASIDNRGRIMYEGDIVRQTERMIENVGVLLAEAGCGFADVAAMTVYLRDPADYRIVNRIFNERFPDYPFVITLAPVCRPGWLVEMECLAIAD